MKANEFIKKYGLRLAKLALAEIHLSDDDGLLRAYKCPKCYTLIVDENTNGHYGCKFCDGTDAELVSFKIDCIDELKRLIESHEIVKKLGGFEKAKEVISGTENARFFGCDIGTAKYWVSMSNEYHICEYFFPNMSQQFAVDLGRLRKAIADVESCQ